MRKLLLPIFIVLVNYIVLETLSFIGYSVFQGQLFSFAAAAKERAVRAALNADVESSQEPVALQNSPQELRSVLHPYLGYVYDGTQRYSGMTHAGLPISKSGFIDNKSPFQKQSPNKVILGFFGGSVAFWQSTHGAKLLTEELQKSSCYRDKKIVIVRTALGGYKQPQQLMALTYLLSQGAKFDLIINLDGFNEVSLSSLNVLQGVYPSFPWTWKNLASEKISPPVQAAQGEIVFIKKQRANFARLVTNSLCSLSVSCNGFWFFLDSYLASRLEQARTSLATLLQKSQEDGYVLKGPGFKVEDSEMLYRTIASRWKQSSVQMSRLSRANSIPYFHFLQPNQYVPNSKSMMPEERQVAYDETFNSKDFVIAGYPWLQKAGKELIQADVNFLDLTMIFKDHPEQTYEDSCCHFSRKGIEIVTRAIAKQIIERCEK